MIKATAPPILKVNFAPDWSQSVPYQSQLATALSNNHGVAVEYLRHYRRILPLWRGLRDLELDLFHLHWPEKFYQIGEHFKMLRRLRYPLDLYLTARRYPLVLTAHNLLPHNTRKTFMQERNTRTTYRLARRVFVHSQRAGQIVGQRFSIPPEKIVTIPFGDLAPPLGAPILKSAARSALELDQEKPIALIFGAIRTYKGIDQVLEWWREHPDLPHLHVVGWGSADDSADAYAAVLENMAQEQDHITVHVAPWLAEPELNAWLSAADVVICNHLRAFSSGGACLARSWGLPLLMPASAEAVDLHEPDPRVIRFDKIDAGFAHAVKSLVALGPDYASAARWRQATAWNQVAEITAATYREVYSENSTKRN